jgi:Uma2 family endonuclease
MSQPYEESLGVERVLRRAPGPRHELICGRLHDRVRTAVATLASTQLLPPRSALTLSSSLKLCPDLALITVATNKVWLAAEIVDPEDHRIDTVDKKQVYEDLKLPRLWMIDPRYDNIEVYHGTEYGLSLRGILAGREVLSEKLLPDFQLVVADLFRAERSSVTG